MTGFTDLPNIAVQSGGRPRGSTITALRDNAISIAECDPTAPTNQATWHPYNRIAPGSTNIGRIYNFPTDGALSTVVTPDYQDGYEYRIKLIGLSPNLAGDLQIENFRETDAAYNPIHTLNVTLSAANAYTGTIELLDVRQPWRVHSFSAKIGVQVGSNSAIAATTFDRMDQFVTAQPILRSRISFLGSSIDAGQILLERRRAYY